jgi:hypothetical protein
MVQVTMSNLMWLSTIQPGSIQDSILEWIAITIPITIVSAADRQAAKREHRFHAFRHYHTVLINTL